MEDIRKTNIPLASKKFYGGLQDEYIEVIDEIFIKNNSKCLKGKKAGQFFDKMKEMSKIVHKGYSNELILLYKNFLEQIRKDVSNFKDSLAEVLRSGKELK